MFFLFYKLSVQSEPKYCVQMGGKRCPDGNYTVLNNEEAFFESLQNINKTGFFLICNTENTSIHINSTLLDQKNISLVGFNDSFIYLENFEIKTGNLFLKSVFVDIETNTSDIYINSLYSYNVTFLNKEVTFRGKHFNGDVQVFSGMVAYFSNAKLQYCSSFNGEVFLYTNMSFDLELEEGNAEVKLYGDICNILYDKGVIFVTHYGTSALKFNVSKHSVLVFKRLSLVSQLYLAGITCVAKESSTITFSVTYLNKISFVWRIILYNSTLVSTERYVPVTVYCMSKSYIKTNLTAFSIDRIMSTNADVVLSITCGFKGTLYGDAFIFRDNCSIVSTEDTDVVVKKVNFVNAIPNMKFGEGIHFKIKEMHIDGSPYIKRLTLSDYSSLSFTYDSNLTTFFRTDSLEMPLEYQVDTEFVYNDFVVPDEGTLFNLMYHGKDMFCAPSINCMNYKFSYKSLISGFDYYSGLVKAQCVQKKNQRCIQIKLNGMPTRVNITVCYSSDSHKCKGFFWVNSKNVSKASTLIMDETRSYTIIVKDDMEQNCVFDLSSNYNNYTIKVGVSSEQETKYVRNDFKINIKLPESLIPSLKIDSGFVSIINTNKVDITNLVVLVNANVRVPSNNIHIKSLVISAISYNINIAQNSDNVRITLEKGIKIKFMKYGVMFTNEYYSKLIKETEICNGSYFSLSPNHFYRLSMTNDATLSKPIPFMGDVFNIYFDESFTGVDKYAVLIDNNSSVSLLSSSDFIPVILHNKSSAICINQTSLLLPQSFEDSTIFGNCHFSNLTVKGKTTINTIDAIFNNIFIEENSIINITMKNYLSKRIHIPSSSKVIFSKHMPKLDTIEIDCDLGNSCGNVESGIFDKNTTFQINIIGSNHRDSKWSAPVILDTNNTALDIEKISFSPINVTVDNILMFPYAYRVDHQILVSYRENEINTNNSYALIFVITLSVTILVVLIVVLFVFLRSNNNRARNKVMLSNLLQGNNELTEE